MKLALIQCPVWGTREPPLGIVQLSGYTKSKGIETKSFDLNNFLYKERDDKILNLWAWEQSQFWYNEEKVNDFFKNNKKLTDSYIEIVMRFNPDVIGFSVSSSTYWSSCALAKLIKEIKRDIVVVFGGQGFYNKDCVDKVFRDTTVDFVISGEGEEVFISLLQTLETKKYISNCKGIFFCDKMKVCSTGQAEPMRNLDRLPYMDFADLRIDDYDDNEHISLMASRGCVWNCVFCSSRSFYQGYRWMSGERIHQEITYQRALNQSLGHIDFADLVFNGNIKRVREFCELMIKYPPYDPEFRIQWIANAIVAPSLTRETLCLMKEAGCQRLIFGIESGSPGVLKKMGKLYDPRIAERIIKDAHDAGIKVTTNFMFGFPGETEEDFQKTLDFIKSSGEYIERVYPSRTFCALEEFSDLHRCPDKFGIKTPFNHHLYWEDISGNNTYPVRLDRCRRFEKLCNDLGVNIDCGVQTSVEMDNWYNLAMYYEHKKDYACASEYYYKYLTMDPKNEDVLRRVKSIAKYNK